MKLFIFKSKVSKEKMQADLDYYKSFACSVEETIDPDTGHKITRVKDRAYNDGKVIARYVEQPSEES